MRSRRASRRRPPGRASAKPSLAQALGVVAAGRTAGRSRWSSSSAVSSRWSRVQVGDEHGVDAARRPPRAARQLDERVAARVRRVRDGGSRAPAGSSCGSTSRRVPRELDGASAWRIRVRFARAQACTESPRHPRSRSHRGGTLGGVSAAPLICVIEDEEVIAARGRRAAAGRGLRGRGRARRPATASRCATACGRTSWCST